MRQKTLPVGIGALRFWVYLFFFLSGFSGLVYEIIWMRKLTLIFGNTVHAVSTTLAVFMGGLALGSFLFGRAADRSSKPLRMYVLLELGIAADSYRDLSPGSGRRIHISVPIGAEFRHRAVPGTTCSRHGDTSRSHSTDGGHPAGDGAVSGSRTR